MSTTLRHVIEPRQRDLGGFTVRRILPSSRQRMVGPFIFLDEMGPAEFPPGAGIDVRPHPHINLATVTYLFEGEILHRDSLGVVQPICPGAVNWMTAGRGIVHSERSGDEERARHARLHGMQSWVALPAADEEMEPSFHHYAADTLPVMAEDDWRLTLIAGEGWGLSSPVAVRSPMFYAEFRCDRTAGVPLIRQHEERAIYVVGGEVTVGTDRYGPGRMLILEPGTVPDIVAVGGSRLMLLGGAPLGERNIWWNFVSSRPERIEQAKSDWRAGRFAAVPGDDEFMPLPED